jgi:predicted GNAT family N-acyltransferase
MASPVPAALTVRVAPPAELDVCLRIRREVFIEGQGVPAAIEVDGLDTVCVHLLATLRGDPIGTARLRALPEYAKAERVAVRAPFRSVGAGRALMEALEAEARRGGTRLLVLNAQVAVVGFYERLGYVAEGEPFLEADIVHRRMAKAL